MQLIKVGFCKKIKYKKYSKLNDSITQIDGRVHLIHFLGIHGKTNLIRFEYI